MQSDIFVDFLSMNPSLGIEIEIEMKTYGKTLERSKCINHGNHSNRILFTNTAVRLGNRVNQFDECTVLEYNDKRSVEDIT